MTRLLSRTSAFLLFLLGGVAVAWNALPHQVASVLISLNNWTAGLEGRSVTVTHGKVGYLEGGEGKTIVFVHGIYARKEHWVEMARQLTEDYHVVALDLPGFGDNSPLPDDQYQVELQAANLVEVFEALKLSDVHIAANSMGAHVAALLVERRPELAASFAFIGSPLGVPSSGPSDMERALAEGLNPLLVRTIKDFEDRNAWLSPNPLEIPAPIHMTWRDAELAQFEKNARIWDAVHEQSTAANLMEVAGQLDLPALILWCHADRIFHPSGAQVLAEALPDARLQMLDECGHVPMIDKPREAVVLYREFLEAQ